MSVFDGIQQSADSALLGVMGTDATYTPRVGAEYAITAILDSGATVNNGERAYYTLWAPLSSFSSEPVRGDRVTINGTQFSVRDVEKDHETGRKLMLSLATPQ